jgi:hypothetical protein
VTDTILILEDNRWLISAIQPRQERFDVFKRRLMSLSDTTPPNRLRLRQTWSRDVNRVSVVEWACGPWNQSPETARLRVKSRKFSWGSKVKSRLRKIEMWPVDKAGALRTERREYQQPGFRLRPRG